MTDEAFTDAEYVLTVRWHEPGPIDAVARYVARVAEWMPVTVIDDSAPALAAAHARALPDAVRHHRPGQNAAIGDHGAARGVHTGRLPGLRPRVIIAAHDVRYDRDGLMALLAAAPEADIVLPQTVLRPQPWQARWDTARSLVTRAVVSARFAGDEGATAVVCRDTFQAVGGMESRLLHDIPELQRTIDSVGGEVVTALDVYVDRLAPSVPRFWHQRIGQAGDSFARPARVAGELALLPSILLAARRPPLLAAVALGTVVVAEVGRRRAGGADHYRADAALWAPVWVAERAVGAWAAIARRLRHR